MSAPGPTNVVRINTMESLWKRRQGTSTHIIIIIEVVVVQMFCSLIRRVYYVPCRNVVEVGGQTQRLERLVLRLGGWSRLYGPTPSGKHASWAEVYIHTYTHIQIRLIVTYIYQYIQVHALYIRTERLTRVLEKYCTYTLQDCGPDHTMCRWWILQTIHIT